jgi:hypothetical protein
MTARRLTDLDKYELRRAILLTSVKSVLLFAAILCIYYALPFDGGRMDTGTWTRLLSDLVVLSLTVYVFARRILTAELPHFRAIEALAVAFPRFICIYAGIYLGLSHQDPSAFNEVLSHTSSLYFTVVTFGTVGFGDIRPVTDIARLIVTSQILVDLVFVAFVVRGIFGISRLAITRSAAGE